MDGASTYLRCSSCGSVNRVALERLDQDPLCGSCKSALHPDEPQNLPDKDSFQKVVLEGDLPVAVDFWAPWCGPCHMVGPLLKDFASEFAGRLLVAKANVDELGELAARHHISGIPAVLVFSKGKEVDRLVGAGPRPRFKAFLERHIL